MNTQEIILRNCTIINEGERIETDVHIKNSKIQKIGSHIDIKSNGVEIDLHGNFLLPGIIDDQVHFREPGYTHKANIHSESLAAVAGGTTSFMEMPNTNPPATTQEKLQDKYDIASKCSPSNYSFFMGASNENLEEVLKTDPNKVCGVKVFMGSSTGNMLVDDSMVLDKLFANVPMLIATHCEDEATIRRNTAFYKQKYGEEVPFELHPIIRSELACYLSSAKAVELAKKHNSRLHILHISTADELSLFDNKLPLHEKRITAEVCVHHMHFTADDYQLLGALVKCNPAIKAAHHKAEIWKGLLDDRLDIIATDHAPHTWDEKQNPYMSAPSGLPLVQHSLVLMMEKVKDGMLSIEKLVEKMAHAPAICFNIENRGFIREGYFADLVELKEEQWKVDKSNVLSKCGWSPFEGDDFSFKVNRTFVNGHIVYENGRVKDAPFGMRLSFQNKL